MRLKLLTGLLWILLGAAPAAADITARYRTGSGDTLTIQVNEHGDSRISRSSSAVLTLGGISYVVAADRAGAFAVRQDAMLIELARWTRERAGPRSRLQLRADIYTAVAAGAETVGGRTGTRWVLREGDREQPDDWVFVISTDPELAILGRALAQQFRLAEYTMAMSDAPETGLGSVPESLLRPITQGTVLRMNHLLSLESIEIGPVPARAFALPRRVLPPARFLARAPWLRRPFIS